MSMLGLSATPVGIERLLTFEYANAMYALPIAEVHEVAEAQRICCVPTIPTGKVGVMNWHGDALPVVAAGLLLDMDGEDESAAAARDTVPRAAAPRRPVRTSLVLVISGRDDEAARLGLPIDRVLGLVDGPRRRRGGTELVVERRPLDGRVLNVLCPRTLVARAIEVIGRQAAGSRE